MTEDILHLCIKGKKPIYLVGIGGVSMSALAELLIHCGGIVSGSDRSDSDTLAKLRALGAAVHIGHHGEQVAGAALVIRTAAVHDDNPEIAAARAQNIPIWERAEAWGSMMKTYGQALCIAGTHGKTTTTSMASACGIEAGLDPAVMVGAYLPSLGGTLRIGADRLIIAESCEYCNSFLSFHPTVAVILNIDADHLDFFSGIDDIIASFRRFASLVPERGAVIANGDDEHVRRAVGGLSQRVITFGMDDKSDFYPADLVCEKGCYRFSILHHGAFVTDVRLAIPGLHNVKNALACAAAMCFLGAPADAVARGLAQFHGAARRFERKGALNGADIFDDYAHHPTEMRATLTTARELGYERVICVFQPHTYSRTKALFPAFVEALRLCDIAVLADIYAAREQNTFGISSRDIADALPGARYFPSFEEIEAYLRDTLRPGDLVLTMGAGDVYKIGEMLAAAGVNPSAD